MNIFLVIKNIEYYNLLNFYVFLFIIFGKTVANSLALSFLKLYLNIPLINFYFQYLKFNTLLSNDRLRYIFFLFFF